MLPVIQLLTPQRTESVLPSQASTSTRDLAVRLSLLLLSTLIALLVPDFGRIASILGCVNLAGCQVLPPLVHLRLCSSRLEKSNKRTALITLDVMLVVIGVATLGYFTLLTARSVLND
mmetsp:Transcript_79833/g.239165  ORF Transcript_79833/g.239165 Transcript_79833/m.239165 type:complete len:118 (-) Transcript_79833:385-738(-)